MIKATFATLAATEHSQLTIENIGKQTHPILPPTAAVTFLNPQPSSWAMLINLLIEYQLVDYLFLTRSILVTFTIDTLSLVTWRSSFWSSSGLSTLLLIAFESSSNTAPNSTCCAFATMGITAQFSPFLHSLKEVDIHTFSFTV